MFAYLAESRRAPVCSHGRGGRGWHGGSLACRIAVAGVGRGMVAKRRVRRNKGAEDASFDPEDWQFNIARAVIARRMRKEDPAEFRKKKRTLQSRIGRYMRQADKHLGNVCKGQFP